MSSPDEMSQSTFTPRHVLVITDAPGERQPLCAELAGIGVKVTCIEPSDCLTHTWYHGQRLVVIDVGREKLEAVLRTVRGCQDCQEISILVEADRLESDPPAGLLPSYRAFACSFEQIVTLIRQISGAAAHNQHSHTLL
jgi:hypothetical protein